MERSESVELLETRLEHWVDSEQSASRALEYAQRQVAETKRRLEVARHTGEFVLNATQHGITDIGFKDGST